MGFFAKDIGLDLGTSNTVVSVKGRGIVVREPSVVAIDKNFGTIIAIGKDAKEMCGRTPENIEAICPIKDGVIADFTATKMMLKHFLDRACQKYVIARPRVVVGVPLGVTEVEKSAVEEAVLEAGAREVYLIEEPMSTAIGAKLKVSEASGTMIVDMGGGTSEIAVISLGGIIAGTSIRIAGDEINEAIISYIKREFNVLIGENTAEYIKKTIGCAYPSMTPQELDVKGRDLQFGIPKTITVNSVQIEEAIKDVIMQIVDGIKKTLEETPTDLASDIMVNGITIAGGCALIKNFDRLIALETGIPVNVAKDPLDCMVKGCSAVLDNLNELKPMLVNTKKIKYQN